MSHRYCVFGGILESAIPIDLLPSAASEERATWSLEVRDEDGSVPGEALGSDIVYGDVLVHGYRSPDGYSLVFDDTGRFDISAGGDRITWFRPAGASLPAAVADLTSRVLAMALHAAGLHTIHASAVSISGAGIAFLAPKFHGKSTLCGALVRAGARAISDDTVPVKFAPRTMLLPGLPRLRLWSDSAHRIFGIEQEAAGIRKHLLDTLPDAQVESRPVPFHAAYLLTPVDALPGGASVSRTHVDSVPATMAMLTHARLGPILTGPESAGLLSRTAEMAVDVPVYSLEVVRDLDRINDVARTVNSWHLG